MAALPLTMSVRGEISMCPNVSAKSFLQIMGGGKEKGGVSIMEGGRQARCR